MAAYRGGSEGCRCAGMEGPSEHCVRYLELLLAVRMKGVDDIAGSRRSVHVTKFT